MIIKAESLVQVSPLYYELIDGSSKKFWEITPTKWTTHGRITTFATAWGRIGCRGSSRERSYGNVRDLDKIIKTKTSKGYIRRPRPSDRDVVQIEGLQPGNIGLVISVSNGWGSKVATLLLDGRLVSFPVRFLAPVT